MNNINTQYEGLIIMKSGYNRKLNCSPFSANLASRNDQKWRAYAVPAKPIATKFLNYFAFGFRAKVKTVAEKFRLFARRTWRENLLIVILLIPHFVIIILFHSAILKRLPFSKCQRFLEKFQVLAALCLFRKTKKFRIKGMVCPYPMPPRTYYVTYRRQWPQICIQLYFHCHL